MGDIVVSGDASFFCNGVASRVQGEGLWHLVGGLVECLGCITNYPSKFFVVAGLALKITSLNEENKVWQILLQDVAASLYCFQDDLSLWY
jgi:hypothetical protein